MKRLTKETVWWLAEKFVSPDVCAHDCDAIIELVKRTKCKEEFKKACEGWLQILDGVAREKKQDVKEL